MELYFYIVLDGLPILNFLFYSRNSRLCRYSPGRPSMRRIVRKMSVLSASHLPPVIFFVEIKKRPQQLAGRRGRFQLVQEESSSNGFDSHLPLEKPSFSSASAASFQAPGIRLQRSFSPIHRCKEPAVFRKPAL